MSGDKGALVPLDRMNMATRAACARFAITTGICLAVGLSVPGPARPAFLTGLFLIPSALTALFAIFHREVLRVDTLGRWDEALAYLALSLLFEALTDEQSREALANLS